MPDNDSFGMIAQSVEQDPLRTGLLSGVAGSPAGHANFFDLVRKAAIRASVSILRNRSELSETAWQALQRAFSVVGRVAGAELGNRGRPRRSWRGFLVAAAQALR